MASGWKLLGQVSSNPNQPVLLLKYEFGNSSYKIWLTDLTHIWVEELKQRPLIQRAWAIDSDIDPVESDQRQMLLRHIQDSLDEKSGTNIALSSDEGSSRIILTTYSPLPKPLQPVKWPIHLTPASQSSLTNELLLPLLAEYLLARDQVTSLLSSLSYKDHIITKLTDKMQTEGIELGKVFPSAMSSKSSCRTTSREELGKSVQGLAVFNEHEWRTQFSLGRDIPGSCRELLSRLSAQAGAFASTPINEQVEPGAWWERLSDGGHARDEEREDSPQSPVRDSVKHETQPRMTPGNPRALSDDRQPSPEEIVLPERGSNPQDYSLKTLDGASTTDTSDDDLDAVQPNLQGQESSKPMNHSRSSSDTNSPEPLPKTSKNPPSNPKGLLGRIGGALKPTTSRTKPKLGQVGGIGTTIKAPSEAPNAGSAQPEKHDKSPSLPRESSPERADRKREQLKRELEEKSKVGVKKKRKF
ncbi:MAG: hypothetical protein Q9172_005272 [Xanthocarpia lactea]